MTGLQEATAIVSPRDVLIATLLTRIHVEKSDFKFPCDCMDLYEKSRTEDRDDALVIPGTLEDTPVMRVSEASKVKNLITFAIKKLNSESVHQIIWSGQGNSVCKAISCAEVMKRRIVEPLHQITQVGFRRLVDIWEPKDKDSELDTLKVNRDVPAIAVLLSLQPLDESHDGYQPPGDFEEFWREKVKKDRHQQRQSKSETSLWQAERYNAKLDAHAEEKPSDFDTLRKAKFHERRMAKKKEHEAYIARKRETEAKKPESKQKVKRRIPKSQRPKSYVSIDNTQVQPMETEVPAFNPSVPPPVMTSAVPGVTSAMSVVTSGVPVVAPAAPGISAMAFNPSMPPPGMVPVTAEPAPPGDVTFPPEAPPGVDEMNPGFQEGFQPGFQDVGYQEGYHQEGEFYGNQWNEGWGQFQQPRGNFRGGPRFRGPPGDFGPPGMFRGARGPRGRGGPGGPMRGGPRGGLRGPGQFRPRGPRGGNFRPRGPR